MAHRRTKFFTLLSALLLLGNAWHLTGAGAAPVDRDHDGIACEKL